MISKKARKLHFSSIVVDTHSDSLVWPTLRGIDIGIFQEQTQLDLPSMRQGNQNVQFFACFAKPELIAEKKVIPSTLNYIDSFYELIRNHHEQIEQATTADDVRRIVRDGKLAGILCIEGGHAIEDDLSVLRAYHKLGVRYMTLTWNNTNNWADGVLDNPEHGGLTHFGKEVVKEMNRLGMIVDISHVAPKTFWDAVQVTSKPVIASHSSAKAICNSPRNMTDDQIRAMASNGGVIGVNYEVTFVGERYRREKKNLDDQQTEDIKKAHQDYPACSRKLEQALNDINEQHKNNVADLQLPHWTEIVDHIDHVVETAGIDHVGLGSDFDGATMPEGMENCSKVPKITDELLKRGYSDQDVRKILGENHLRVMEEVIN